MFPSLDLIHFSLVCQSFKYSGRIQHLKSIQVDSLRSIFDLIDWMEFILVISYHSLNVFSKSFKNEIDIFFKIYLLTFLTKLKFVCFFPFWKTFLLTTYCKKFWNFWWFFLWMTIVKGKLELSDVLEKGRIVWTSCDANQLSCLIEITRHTDIICLVFKKVKIASCVNLPQGRKTKDSWKLHEKEIFALVKSVGVTETNF